MGHWCLWLEMHTLLALANCWVIDAWEAHFACSGKLWSLGSVGSLIPERHTLLALANYKALGVIDACGLRDTWLWLRREAQLLPCPLRQIAPTFMHRNSLNCPAPRKPHTCSLQIQHTCTEMRSHCPAISMPSTHVVCTSLLQPKRYWGSRGQCTHLMHMFGFASAGLLTWAHSDMALLQRSCTKTCKKWHVS